jgi:hypothetical protein
MITLKINNKEYGLPEGWSEVNLDKFEKIMVKNSQIKEYKSQILFGLEVLSILIDCEVDDLKNLTRASFETLSNEISWINEAPVGIEKDNFIIEGEMWRPIKDLNKLTMGDNISIELMIGESNETNILNNILPILMRKVRGVKGEGGITYEELEPFDSMNYVKTRGLLSKSVMITDVINFKDFFLSGEKVSSTTMKDTSVKEKKSRKRVK